MIEGGGYPARGPPATGAGRGSALPFGLPVGAGPALRLAAEEILAERAC